MKLLLQGNRRYVDHGSFFQVHQPCPIREALRKWHSVHLCITQYRFDLRSEPCGDQVVPSVQRSYFPQFAHTKELLWFFCTKFLTFAGNSLCTSPPTFCGLYMQTWNSDPFARIARSCCGLVGRGTGGRCTHEKTRHKSGPSIQIYHSRYKESTVTVS